MEGVEEELEEYTHSHIWCERRDWYGHSIPQ